MKRLVRWGASFALFIMLPMTVSACINCGGRLSIPDKQAAPVVSVIIDEHGKEDAGNSVLCYDVFGGGRIKKRVVYDSDNARIYTAAYSDLSSSVENGKVTVTLADNMLSDENGGEFAAEGTLMDILKTAAHSAEHDIIELKIINRGDEYYVFEKHNVNWSDPCVLLRYDENSGSLERLYQWDNVDLVGLARPASETDGQKEV